MITDQAIEKTGLRLESDPMSMRRSCQLISGMSLLLGYDSGPIGRRSNSRETTGKGESPRGWGHTHWRRNAKSMGGIFDL